MFYSNQNDLNAHDIIITMKAAYFSYHEWALFIVPLTKVIIVNF